MNKLKIDESCLLGAPLIPGTAIDTTLANRCEDLDRAIDRLHFLNAHDALVLLRACFSAPRILHTIRCSPCAGKEHLVQFDKLLRKELIANSDLSDIQWTQASLLVREGGLGIRRVASLAPSAFLASSASTRTLQSLLLGLSSLPSEPVVDSAAAQWSSIHGLTQPDHTLAAKQCVWDAPVIAGDNSVIWASLTDNQSRARLLVISAPHSGDWLHALPVAACGTRLDDEAVRVAVGLHLEVNLCEPHPCSCGTPVYAHGTHGLSCKRSAGRSTRHHQLNYLIWRAFGRASVPSIKEPNGLFRSDGKRPDGLTLIPWQAGRCLAWDATVVDTLAASYIQASSTAAGSVAKVAKYSAISQIHIFVPLAVETLGVINQKGVKFLSELANHLRFVTDDPRESSFLFQHISILIQRFNASCFQGTLDQPEEADV